jgi:hypothetical protein
MRPSPVCDRCHADWATTQVTHSAQRQGPRLTAAAARAGARLAAESDPHGPGWHGEPVTDLGREREVGVGRLPAEQVQLDLRTFLEM